MGPSRASVKGFLGSIRGTIRAHAGGALRELIRLLNPRIRGGVNYYRHLVSSRVFTKVLAVTAKRGIPDSPSTG
jgi:RNA-directed DNA polymerase